ncbi:FAD-binding oxidoreductase [Xylanimonas ulmi]|uniref:FAD/FMN-containing dehydrogenase n=1 Tax=Xylanimonas ulmi TaxID=228973 RepID=A0A4Q7LZR7_9MICO|nr:FAD-binding protein [Xylanibacterium ulmi]RZS60514.1 FAD/FMN-containing dehydrogenase [Xylanibacterium ulmi]
MSSLEPTEGPSPRAATGGSTRLRVATPDDVTRALRAAAAAGRRVTTAAARPGADVLDLTAFDTTTLTPSRQSVEVGAGVTWERLIASIAPHRLAVLAGEDLARPTVADTLAGAVGPLARTFGLACDHVLSVDLVTPDGDCRTVSPETDQELFCALRGGVEGLGVPIGMSLGLVPLTTLYAGAWWYGPGPASRVATVLSRWGAWLDGLPESMSTGVALTAVGGEGLALAVRFAHAGDPAEGRALIAELRETVPAPGRSTLADLPADRAHRLLRELAPERGPARGALLASMPDAVLDGVVAAMDAAAQGTTARLRLQGGALGRQAPIPGCVPGRDAAFSLRASAVEQAGADALIDALSPWTTGGAARDLGDPRDARSAQALRAAWSAPALARLTELRQKFDPDGVLDAPWEPVPGRA